jgi:PKD repeat protein
MKRSLLLFVLLSLCRFAFGQNEPGAMFVQSHYQSCAAPFTVTFKDSSWSPTRTPLVFWKWEFADGTVDSSGAIVNHTFLQKGFFRVKLTVRDQLGREGTYTADDYQLIRIGAALQMPSTGYICNSPQPVTLRNLAMSQWYDSVGTYQWVLNGNVVSTARSWQTTQPGIYQLNYTACGTTLSDSVSIEKATISPGTLSPVAWLNDTAKLTFSVMNSPYDPSKVNQVSWAWGDGSASVVKGLNSDVIHGYTVPGTYNVRATVRLNNPADLVCDSVGTYTVNVRAPYVTHNVWNRMDTLYTGGDKTYLISATNTGATFKWRSMDPGFAASTQTMSTSYPGKYWVEISKSGDVITDTINLMPKANFTFTIPQCVQATSTKFYLDILVPVFDSLLSLTWHYGDGKSEVYTKSQFGYDHSYDAPGIYKVVLEVRYKSGYYATASKYVPVYPVINWAVDIKDDTVSAPGMHILKAIDMKSVNAKRVLWYPGKRNPVNKFLSDTIQATVPGLYIAYLIDSCSNRRAADTIEVRDRPTSEWSANVRTDYASNCMDVATLSVSSNAAKGSYRVLWNTGATSDSILVDRSGGYGFILTDSLGRTRKDSVFVTIYPREAATLRLLTGNGRDSLVAAPYNAGNEYFFYRNDTLLSTAESYYSSIYFDPIPGVYKVTVKNIRGCRITSEPLYYRVSKDSIAVNFSYSADKCNSRQIKFIGTSASSTNEDTVRSIKWNFGDGTTATYPAGNNTVTHNYDTTGIYTVSLSATTAAGRTFSVSKQVVVQRIAYSVNIVSDTASLPGTNILRAVKNPTDAFVTWSTGSTNDTIHVHTSGYYSVWMKDSCGNVRAADTLLSLITDTWNVDAVVSRWTRCGDTAVLSANISMFGNGYVTWSNGVNGYINYVTTAGVYTATLRDSNGNAMAEDSVYVEMKPFKAGVELHRAVMPGNDTLIAYPLQPQSSAEYDYKWYRDGLEVASGNVPMLFNPASGTYNVFVRSKAGCSAFSDTIYLPPAIRWALNAQIGGISPCGDSALLVTSVTAPDSNYIVTWNTGQQSPSFYVTTSGNYIATLKDMQGNIQAVDSVDVELKPFKARLELHRSPVPDNDTLIVYPNDAAYYYRWYRNDTPLMSGPSPILHYPTPGVYQVYATNEAGCNATTDTIHYKIDDLPVPVDISYEVSGCDSQFVRFHGIVETQDEVTYSWNFGDQSYMEGEFASHRYAPGTYNVVLTATTSSGATGTITKQLVITATKATWIADITRLNNQCGDTVWLTASSNHARVGYFSWNTGVQIKTITVTRSGRYAVSVYDTCYNERAYDSIDVIINAPCRPTDTISIGDGPVEGGKVLPVIAGFDHGFNQDNIFTVQLTLKNPGGRETGLQQDEVINLGIMPGTTKDIAMEVNIPDTLACATSYAVRVVASSPADTTAWSKLFTVTNQPAQPVITQRGDSLFTSGKYNWQWYLNDKAIEGATSTVYRAKANGAYTVESLNGNGCTSRSSAVSVIITAVGEVTLGGNKVKAFPNPSEGQVSLQFEKPLLKAVTINIYSLNGRVMYTRTTTQQLQPLDLSALPKGYYLIELTGFGTKKVLTLILQ